MSRHSIEMDLLSPRQPWPGAARQTHVMYRQNGSRANDPGANDEDDDTATDVTGGKYADEPDLIADLRKGPTSQTRMMSRLGSPERSFALVFVMFMTALIFVVAIIMLALTTTLWPFIPTYAFGSIYVLLMAIVPWVFPLFMYVAPSSRTLPIIILVLAILYLALSIVVIITAAVEIAVLFAPTATYSTPLAVGAWAALVAGLMLLILTGMDVFFAVRLLPPERKMPGERHRYLATPIIPTATSGSKL